MRPVIEYGPGDHDITDTIVVANRAIVRGQGVGVTTFHNRTSSLLNGYAFTTEQHGVNDIIYENFSLNNEGHRIGVTAFGSGHLAHNLEVFNHASNVDDTGEELESFAVLFDSPEGLPCTNNRIQSVVLRDFHNGYNGGLVIAGKGGQTLGMITDCAFFGSGIPGPLHNMEGVMGANEVRNCTFVNCALGVYTEGGLDTMMVEQCRFLNHRGSACRINLEAPQRTFMFRNNFVHLNNGVGVEVKSMQNKLETLTITGNIFEGTGRWMDVRDTHLVLFSNRYQPGLTHMVERCTGELANNASTDGEWASNRLAKDKPGKSQLKTKLNDAKQP